MCNLSQKKYYETDKHNEKQSIVTLSTMATMVGNFLSFAYYLHILFLFSKALSVTQSTIYHTINNGGSDSMTFVAKTHFVL